MMVFLKAKHRKAKACKFQYQLGTVTAVLLGVTMLEPAPAGAQNNRNSCTIIVDNTPGVLRQNADTSILSSKHAGGQPARAVIVATNSRFRASIDSPSGFSVFPNNGNQNTEFSSTFSSRGATKFLSVSDDVERRIKRGRSRIRIDMTARRLNGSFPSGNYQATVTLRCE
ncbi:MAG: hypothetical protein AAGF25_07415 [Pseudomonadota bacterium]